MENRKGIVKINTHLFKDDFGHESLCAVFSKFVPIFITEDFNGKFYHGISSDFDEVKEGHPVPHYEAEVLVSVKKHGAGHTFSVDFKKL